MWYWIKRIEGVFYIPLLPLYLIYWRLRKITFYFRCKNCGSPWLFLDLRNMRYGTCEKCLLDALFSPNQTASQKDMFEETGLPVVKPEFDWLFERMAKKAVEGKSLDVGCQSAYMFTKFQTPRESLYGIDVTPGPLKVAAQNLKGANFCQADATRIPYKSNSFEYLFCTEVLEHIPNGEAVIQDCYRVLKPGGSAFFTVPNGQGVAGKYMVAHIRFFTYQSLTNILKETGFEIVSGKKYGLYIPFVSSFSVMFSYILGRRLPFNSFLWKLRMPEFLSVTFFIECRKPVK
jgi:2-polyprenyl-3-methyl-5-hydroxy-6-metoxy-1,4-benzoquinol methylase